MANSVVTAADRSESVRQTSSYYHTTLLPYYRPEASSSRRQYHAREAAYLPCIDAYNPSPRIGRAGGADAYTPTTPHQQSTATRKKLTLSLQCSCVSYCGAGGSSVRFSSKLRLLAVTVYLSLYPTTTTQRLCCFVREALPELFLACCYRSNSKRCV